MATDAEVRALRMRVSKLENVLGFIARGQVILSGAGAPTIAAASGSVYLRTDGSGGSRVYVNQGGTSWLPIAGV
jgi:hypothetical protein